MGGVETQQISINGLKSKVFLPKNMAVEDIDNFIDKYYSQGEEKIQNEAQKLVIAEDSRVSDERNGRNLAYITKALIVWLSICASMFIFFSGVFWVKDGFKKT